MRPSVREARVARGDDRRARGGRLGAPHHGGRLKQWVGPAATAEPAPGGELRWMHPDGSTVVGRFLELVPHRRVVFTYGWEDGRMGVPPESTTVEIELDEHDGQTTLRLSHHGLPPETVPDHQRGWEYFLGRLRAAAIDP
jgi:uncharacterized protein YndB with AHSA1/START domain